MDRQQDKYNNKKYNMARPQAPAIDSPQIASTTPITGRGQVAVDSGVSLTPTVAVRAVASTTVSAQGLVGSATTAVVAPVSAPITIAVPRAATVSPSAATTTVDTSVAPVIQRVTQNISVNNVAGAIGDVQFYRDGKFSADSDFKYWSDSDTLQLNGWLKTANLQVGNVANLGQVANLVILGGTSGDILRTDGNGNVTWTSISVAGGSNNINDGSSTVSIETNSNVNFTVGGNANVMTVTDAGAIANVFTSNNFILGNSTTTISTNRWLDAVTMTTNPTVLFTAANTVSSIDVHITADDGTSKQITKMLSVTKDTNTSYSQYGNVVIGTEMASFYMDQSGGLVRVIATPSSANRVDYRLVVTLYQ
jgi:hypothetical protein